jgi:hypothetical protein
LLYPPRLAVLDDAPPLLGVCGVVEVLMRPVIAIVGVNRLGPDADRRAKLLICLAVKGSLLDAYSQLSGRKGIRHRQRVPLVGFQSNLLGQHDVARDEIIPRHEAPASPRSASVV